MTSLRDNWRVVALTVFLVLSGVALFVPAGISDGGGLVGGDGPTNLEYGLELDGGTRIRAPVNGVTAEQVQVDQGTRKIDVKQRVAGNLSNVSVSDVTVQFPTSRGQGTSIVVASETVTPDEFRAALDRAGIEYGTVREGVTGQVRSEIVRILRDKISKAGLSGGQVQQVTTASNEHFVVIEMPNTNQSEMERLVTQRGKVTVVAEFPAQNGSGTRNETVIRRQDIASVSPAEETDSGTPQVPIVLTQNAAPGFAEDMRQYGFASEGISSCHGVPQGQRYCLKTVVDGDVIYSAGMSPGLARSFRNGNFVQQPTFVMQTANMSSARQLQINLNAGALPASLDTDAGTTYYLAPTLAEDFKLYSLITGLAAVLAVSGTVFVRYGDPKVAAPMLVTALSEVVILLGFAAAIRLPLDLSHIAGFIAVIGTGVDDLIIIADEVMAEGEVNSGRVFQSRFRKAFWVIGAAAATTILAMSPLAVLSLGDLQGFAIITILGVLVGVLLTRPAYGDILRRLLTDR